MIDVNISIPVSDVDALNATLQKYAEHFKGNIPKTTENIKSVFMTSMPL